MPRTPEEQRAHKRAEYAEYKQRCLENNVYQRRDGWHAHLLQLRGVETKRERTETREELERYWLDRHSPEWILEVGRSLDMLNLDRSGFARKRTSPVSGKRRAAA